jgi:hypothetical protein
MVKLEHCHIERHELLVDTEKLVHEFDTLTVWKAVCLLSDPPAGKYRVDPNAMNCYHAWRDWRDHGWKAHKRATFQSNEIGIIVQSVSQFID